MKDGDGSKAIRIAVVLYCVLFHMNASTGMVNLDVESEFMVVMVGWGTLAVYYAYACMIIAINHPNNPIICLCKE